MASIEPEKLGEYFDAHSRALVLYARQWVASTGAEDLVQEVFLRLMRQPSAPENVKAWLFRSVRNAAVSRWRRRTRRARREKQAAENHRAWFETSAAASDRAETVQSALAQLPEGQREIVILRLWGKLTLREISETTGRPVSTLSDRYRAALAAMKRNLERSWEHETR